MGHGRQDSAGYTAQPIATVNDDRGVEEATSALGTKRAYAHACYRYIADLFVLQMAIRSIQRPLILELDRFGTSWAPRQQEEVAAAFQFDPRLNESDRVMTAKGAAAPPAVALLVPEALVITVTFCRDFSGSSPRTSNTQKRVLGRCIYSLCRVRNKIGR